jgi:hypothetical protein
VGSSRALSRKLNQPLMRWPLLRLRPRRAVPVTEAQAVAGLRRIQQRYFTHLKSQQHHCHIMSGKRVTVQLFKFEELPNRRGYGKEFKVTNNLTGAVIQERVSDRHYQWDRFKEKGRELYYVDSKTKVLDEDLDDNVGESPQLPSARAASTSASRRPTPPSSESSATELTLTAKKTLIKAYTWQQKHDILNEILYGEQTRECGAKIEFVDRAKHGNLGPFFTSVCAILNDSTAYPSFKASKAVVASVRQFLDASLTAQRLKLTKKFGPNFHEHTDFMDYSSLGSDDDEEMGDKHYMHQVNMFLDALVFQECEQQSKPSAQAEKPKQHTEAEEQQMQESQADGITGKQGAKRFRVEKVKEKPVNHVSQLQEQHNDLTSLISDMLKTQPDSSALPAAAAVVPEDAGLTALRVALLGLPKPPGLAFVCQKLAEGLAATGITSLQELFEYRDDDYAGTAAMLTGLNWSQLQVRKVLGEPP